jgi:hypothetical protein
MTDVAVCLPFPLQPVDLCLRGWCVQGGNLLGQREFEVRAGFQYPVDVTGWSEGRWIGQDERKHDPLAIKTAAGIGLAADSPQRLTSLDGAIGRLGHGHGAQEQHPCKLNN